MNRRYIYSVCVYVFFVKKKAFRKEQKTKQNITTENKYE